MEFIQPFIHFMFDGENVGVGDHLVVYNQGVCSASEDRFERNKTRWTETVLQDKWFAEVQEGLCLTWTFKVSSEFDYIMHLKAFILFQ